MSIAAWRSPGRGRAHRSFLVALPLVRDLFFYAKHLFVAAITVWHELQSSRVGAAHKARLRAIATAVLTASSRLVV